MSNDFRSALLWHMREHGTRIADLAKGAGVSADIIKKLRTRDNASTSAETAAKISAFYGKSVSQFIAREEASDTQAFNALLELLYPAERKLVLHQIRGLIENREEQ